MALKSTDVVAGTNGTIKQYNDLRADLREHTHDGTDTARAKVNRSFAWYLDGGQLVLDEVGAKYIVPANMTVNLIQAVLGSGTATIRIQKGTTTIQDGISVTSTVADTTSFDEVSLTAGDIITLDITAVSSAVNLTVIMTCSEP